MKSIEICKWQQQQQQLRQRVDAADCKTYLNCLYIRMAHLLFAFCYKNFFTFPIAWYENCAAANICLIKSSQAKTR